MALCKGVVKISFDSRPYPNWPQNQQEPHEEALFARRKLTL